jgi:hypothetical protein
VFAFEAGSLLPPAHTQTHISTRFSALLRQTNLCLASLCILKRLIQLKHEIIRKALRVRAMNNNNKLPLGEECIQSRACRHAGCLSISQNSSTSQLECFTNKL